MHHRSWCPPTPGRRLSRRQGQPPRPAEPPPSGPTDRRVGPATPRSGPARSTTVRWVGQHRRPGRQRPPTTIVETGGPRTPRSCTGGGFPRHIPGRGCRPAVPGPAARRSSEPGRRPRSPAGPGPPARPSRAGPRGWPPRPRRRRSRHLVSRPGLGPASERPGRTAMTLGRKRRSRGRRWTGTNRHPTRGGPGGPGPRQHRCWVGRSTRSGERAGGCPPPRPG